MPGMLQKVLDRYPIIIATTRYAESPANASVIAALTGYFRKAKDRALGVSSVYDAAPTWKQLIIEDAQALLLLKERRSLYGDALDGTLAHRYAESEEVEPWAEFVGCVAAAGTFQAGMACYYRLDARTLWLLQAH